MRTYLGIDGGGTKTKLILCDPAGRVLAESIQPTCGYIQVGLEGVTRVLSAGLRALFDGSGTRPEQVAFAFAGIPCFGDTEADRPGLLAAVARAMGAIPHRVGNDVENALAGALAGASGIQLVCGTGSIACGRNGAGEALRCGGWHHAIGGDEGSGYWIGIQLLRRFTRQSDGRDPRTALYGAVRSTLALQEDGDVIPRVVEQWGMDRTRIAALSRLMGPLLEAGDPNAPRILEAAASELADMAVALYRRLGFSGEAPVSYSGGIFNLGAPILDPLARKLSGERMRLRPPKYPPDLGAVVLACQCAGQPVPEGLGK